MLNGHSDSYVQAAIDGEVARLAAAAVGERNQALFKATAALASLGLQEGAIIRHLKSVAEGIGLRGRELYSTIKSGVKTGHSNPRVKQCMQVQAVFETGRSKNLYANCGATAPLLAGP